MFPIRDTVPARSFPVINWLLIIANVLVFVLIEVPLASGALSKLILSYGVVPARLYSGSPAALITIVSSMFLHGGWLHLISNVWALFIFGDNVEDRMGAGRYFVFYLVCGAVAAMAQAAVDPASRIPAIGASGAIAGVLAAYFISFPRSRVVTFIPVFFLPWFVEIPAVIYLGFWFFSQFFNGVLALDMGSLGGGIAYWAHIGGFLAGLVLLPFFARPSRVLWRSGEYGPR